MALKHRRGKKDKKKRTGRYQPMLSRTQVMRQRDKWEDQQPDMSDRQRARLGEILRTADTRRQEITSRFDWAAYHERLENEVADRVYTDDVLGGIRVGIEWRVYFFRNVHQAMLQAQRDNDPVEAATDPYLPYMDGIVPDAEFLASTFFEGIEQFQPRIVMYQFEEKGRWQESAEEAIWGRENRRSQGDAYFTDAQRAMQHLPSEGGDTTPLPPINRNPDPEGA
jgi:hypothetical protein